MTRQPYIPEERGAVDLAACSCTNLRKAARVVTRAYDTAFRPIGLRATQFTLLASLAQRGGVPLTGLAEMLVIDRTTLTRNLKPLVGRGLVRVDRGEDRRVRRVGLTEAGKAILDEAIPLWRKAQSRLVDSLGRERWSGFLDDLPGRVDLTLTR